MSSPHPDWTGVYCAVPTQFGGDGALDLACLRMCIGALLEAGVHGIVMLDGVGEASTLEPVEKVALVKSAVTQAQDRVPVIAALIEPTTSAAVHLAKAAAGAGAAGLIAREPLGYCPGVTEFCLHAATLAKATDLPLMVDASSWPYQQTEWLDIIERLEDVRSLAAVTIRNCDARRTGELRSRFGDRYRLMCDSDDEALHALSLGA